jgi:hypothetical protein
MPRIESQWYAYHFFYSGDRNLVLHHFVRPTVWKLQADHCIDSFFFIRYPLGGPHIRLRLRVLPGQIGIVEDLLARAAGDFLARWPSGDVQEGRIDLAEAIPQDRADDAGYPDNSLLRFTFEPEVERYGGERLLPCSLNFFFVSSVSALDWVAAHFQKPWASQLPRALSLLVQQARGFAHDEREFLDLFTYRLPVMPAVAESVCARGDAVFEAQRDVFMTMVFCALNETSALGEAARCLSREIQAAAPDVRRQIGTSQIHMTANRLGLSNPEEIYLGRIVCRAVREIEETEPATWSWFLESLADRQSEYAVERGA